MQTYEDVFVAGLFTPWASQLLDEVGLSLGDAVLDVACGPGTVTRIAAARVGRSGRAVGADISASMLAVARAKPAPEGAEVEYVESPAAPLGVPDETFDVVVCQQGLQFFPDRDGALREMRRALRPGGRVAVAVWGDIEENDAFAALSRVVGEVFGPETRNRYREGPWGFPSLDELRALVESAGFAAVHAAAYTLEACFDSAARFAESLAASPVAADVAALDDAGRAALADAVARHVGPLERGSVLPSRTLSNIAVAERP
jgi:ubiquinone/menaquinone biosynthesis C-methylase UbiE